LSAEQKTLFSNIVDTSLKVLEKSDAGLVWLDQVRRVVACELLMGAG
jgi:hypothetical protein